MKTTVLFASLFLTLTLTACGNSEPVTEKPELRQPGEDAREHDEGSEDEAEEHGEGHDEDGDDHEGEARAVLLTDAQAIASGIRVEKAAPASIRQTLSLYGTVVPNAERVRQVTARFPGVVRSVTKRVGDSTREGESLATVESDESLRTYAVLSPLTGVVTERNANPGEYAANTVLFTVADLSTVWVELSIFPRDVSQIRVGQSVQVKSPDSSLSADGQVVYVAPFGQADNQTLTARVLIDNADRRWAPGLYVTADVTLSEAEVPVAIHNDAVQSLEGANVVFVKNDRGFAPAEVKLGRADGEFTEVISGVAAGTPYAATNSFILKADLGKGSAEHGH